MIQVGKNAQSQSICYGQTSRSHRSARFRRARRRPKAQTYDLESCEYGQDNLRTGQSRFRALLEEVPTSLFECRRPPDTVRGLFHSHSTLNGKAQRNKADGPIERMVSSKSLVKSKYWAMTGPNWSSILLVLFAIDPCGRFDSFGLLEGVRESGNLYKWSARSVH